MEEEWWSCDERDLNVDNTHFKHKSLHKYTRMAWGQDRVELKSMIDLVLVKNMLYYMHDVRAVIDLLEGITWLAVHEASYRRGA